MKTINFKRTDSALRIWDDDPKAKKQINWDRIIYIILLLIILFFGGRYLINRFLYVNATGHILFEKRNIRNVDDSQLIQFFVAEGDSVQAGDTLFSFISDDDNGRDGGGGGGAFSNSTPVNVAVSQGGGGNDDWKIKEIYNLKKTISSNRIRIAENQKLLDMYIAQKKRIKEQVILDLTPRSKLDDLDESIKQTDFEIQRLKSETAEAAAFINTLNNMNKPEEVKNVTKISNNNKTRAIGGSSGGGGDEPDYRRYYLSPIDGTITKINFQGMEVALKSEIIMSIHKPENIYVKGFFDQSDIGNVAIGDEVHVQFPDGSNSLGRIKRFYYATNAIPEEFQKKYEPITRTLLADVVPINNEELKKWRTFYRMSVKIYKYKF
ncbi:MAG TPA: HlyD family secretion protein [Flavobacteriales bacterium]|nr:HlyD family secretion protein [Flavobacteriales bacterium]